MHTIQRGPFSKHALAAACAVMALAAHAAAQPADGEAAADRPSGRSEDAGKSPDAASAADPVSNDGGAGQAADDVSDGGTQTATPAPAVEGGDVGDDGDVDETTPEPGADGTKRSAGRAAPRADSDSSSPSQRRRGDRHERVRETPTNGEGGAADEAAERSLHLSLVDDGWVALRAHGGLAFRNQRSVDLYTSDDTLPFRGLGLGVDVWRPMERVAVAADADFFYERAASSSIFGRALSSGFRHQRGTLGVSVRYRLGQLHELLDLVQPHLRIYGIVARTKQRLRDGNAKLTYQTPYQFTGGAGAAIGLGVATPTQGLRSLPLPRPSLAVRAELAYEWIGDPEFRVERSSEGEHAIPIAGARVGALQLDALQLRVTVELRI